MILNRWINHTNRMGNQSQQTSNITMNEWKRTQSKVKGFCTGNIKHEHKMLLLTTVARDIGCHG